MGMSPIEQSFSSNLHAVLSLIPAVREGDADAIHDARVATRRLRATLPILSGGRSSEAWDEAACALKTAGRALGKARDADVALELLREFETRAPATAATTAAVRAWLLPQHLKRRRKLIKRLETLDLGSLANGVGTNGRRRLLPWRAPSLQRGLIAAIHERAGALREAVERASGVYFPARTHEVRVASKKLRYLVELLDETEPRRRRALKVLRQVQEKLGRIHDREMLVDRLKRMRRKEDLPESNALKQVLEAEARSLFAEYVELRDEIIELAESLQRWSAGSSPAARVRRHMLKMTAVAVPSAAVVLMAARPAAQRSERALSNAARRSA